MSLPNVRGRAAGKAWILSMSRPIRLVREPTNMRGVIIAVLNIAAWPSAIVAPSPNNFFFIIAQLETAGSAERDGERGAAFEVGPTLPTSASQYVGSYPVHRSCADTPEEAARDRCCVKARFRESPENYFSDQTATMDLGRGSGEACKSTTLTGMVRPIHY
jgi:hypothetical protein